MVFYSGLTFVLMTFLSGSMIDFVGGVKKTIVRKLVAPIGENQQLYCDYLADMKVGVVAGLGPAGCGKTLFACQAAVSALVAKDVDKIIMTRPMVSVDEELGFLPGSLEQKMELMKKMAGEESYYDKPCDTCGHTPCECDSEQPDEVEIVKKNAGLVPVTAMMLGGDEPFEG